jgi:hypothetical protein
MELGGGRLMNLFDSVRGVLRVRKQRAKPPAGPKPRLGAKIVKDDLRMSVQAGLTLAAWYWLLEQGWREETFRNDRRLYREVPSSRVAELFDAADPDERSRVLQLAIGEAKVRPSVALLRRH